MLGNLVESVDVLSGAGAVFEAHRAGRRFSKRLSAVALTPVKSRGEPLGVTRLRRAGGQRGFAVFEEGVCFPLPAVDVIRWGLEGLRPQGPEGASPTA
jgi:hypothetical protein